MFRPSSIKLPAGSTYQLDEVNTGIYVVTNAYEGRYEYFDARPIADDCQAAVAQEPAPQDSHDASVPAPAEVNRG